MKKERKTKPIKEKKEESTKNIYAKSKRIIYQGNKNMKPITDFFKSEIVLLNQIQMKHPEKKQAIAQKVWANIPKQASIFFDSSTTVEAAIRAMENSPIHAITNSLSHALLLAQMDQTKITVLPGQLHKQQLFLFGAETVAKVGEFAPDYTLLGVFALSEQGLFIHTEEEGQVKRRMIQQGKQVIALADQTKLNKTGLFKICELTEIDCLVTDTRPDEKFCEQLAQAGVTLIVADE
ncbi:TPA: DeoR/GlpR family DNA-binding transcription regulator [Enterococcus faecalis]